MNTEQNLTIITPTDLQNAGSVLAQNTSYLNIYRKSHSKLLEKAKAEGTKLKPETDEAMNKWQVSAKLALKKMEEERKPYTQKAMEFVKVFTSTENALSKDLYQSIQDIRNASATAYAKEEEEKQRQEADELAKKQERIRLLADAEQQVRDGYASILREEKANLLKSFENATADNIDEVEANLKNLKPTFLKTKWDEIPVNLTSRLDQSEIDNVITNSRLGKFDKCSAHFKSEIKNYAAYLVSLIPARREEIAQGIASKEAEELKRKQEAIEEAQRKAAQEKAEEERIEKLKEEELQLQIDQANRRADAPDTRTISSCSITVSTREAWLAIVGFFFENSTETDMGKVKLDQMKAFAERWAKSHGEKIEHPGISYEVKYKAVAKAARKDKVAA